MRKITLYARIFLTAFFIFVITFAMALALRFSHWEYFAVFALMGTALMAALFSGARRKHMTAKAITESAVIWIQPAVIRGNTEEKKVEEAELRENFGIYVSCFGILIGTKIIKFNQNGIWLRSVEIGKDYITFGYGEADEELESIRLLYSRPDEDALEEIIENFRKETGIIPTILV